MDTTLENNEECENGTYANPVSGESSSDYAEGRNNWDTCFDDLESGEWEFHYARNEDEF